MSVDDAKRELDATVFVLNGKNAGLARMQYLGSLECGAQFPQIQNSVNHKGRLLAEIAGYVQQAPISVSSRKRAVDLASWNADQYTAGAKRTKNFENGRNAIINTVAEMFNEPKNAIMARRMLDARISGALPSMAQDILHQIANGLARLSDDQERMAYPKRISS